MTSVQVAVRVRPFTDREIQLHSKLCIYMSDKATTIRNIDGDSKSYTFIYDYSYWSHDGYFIEKSGYFSPADPKYIDQIKVHEDIGKGIIENAWDGYNATLFAYGQTGAGKTYTIVGYESNLGIIGRVCEELFIRIANNRDQHIQYEVEVSMLEVYNEQVHDLLIKPSMRVSGGLKVQKTPKGTIVAGLTKHRVQNYLEIQAKLDEGTNNRTIGASQMNLTSSRAHTVFTIMFKQIRFNPATAKPVSEMKSDINLVDLAGSERGSAAGTSTERWKEGTHINKSLSVLGKVIAFLAEKGSGKGDSNLLPPYRDSALTRILQNALEGNSKTTMIASVSPASLNFSESLSTLRFADRMKNIKTNAKVNENAYDNLVQELQQEIERLKQIIMSRAAHESLPGDLAAAAVSHEQEELIIRQHDLAELVTRKQKSIEEVARTVEASKTPIVVASSHPCIKNINEDPFLSGKLVYPISEGINTIGKIDFANPPDILIGGAGITKEHAKITMQKVYHEDDSENYDFNCSIEAAAKVVVNGGALEANKPKELSHKDRILFGNHNLFVYFDPFEEDKTLPEWDEMMKEASKDYFDQFKNNSLLGTQNIENLRNQDQEAAQAEMVQNSKLLQEYITHTIVLLEEVNLIAEEMGRPVFFSLKLVTKGSALISKRESPSISVSDHFLQNTEINICVHRLDIGKVQFWSLDLFEAQIFEIRELYAEWTNRSGAYTFPISNDPFTAVEDSYHLIGNAYIFLEHLRNLISFDDEKVPILDYKGKKVGSVLFSLEISLEPLHPQLTPDASNLKSYSATVEEEFETLDDYLTVSDLIGRTLNFKIFIEEAEIYEKNYCRNIHIEYIWIDKKSAYKIPSVDHYSTNPKFMHVNYFSVFISADTVEWFNSAMIFQVSGMSTTTELPLLD